MTVLGQGGETGAVKVKGGQFLRFCVDCGRLLWTASDKSVYCIVYTYVLYKINNK